MKNQILFDLLYAAVVLAHLVKLFIDIRNHI
jgi:hypothetical protein